ncbi:vomeronasal type-2 receptor 116-like [Leptodactylus fuscus]|uniref:vomeronasal type-2 receptor 116-like n=1 Tax=Leptodactylus fuscus TaxID=238119 RepID=UPI003F4F1CEF
MSPVGAELEKEEEVIGAQAMCSQMGGFSTQATGEKKQPEENYQQLDTEQNLNQQVVAYLECTMPPGNKDPLDYGEDKLNFWPQLAEFALEKLSCWHLPTPHDFNLPLCGHLMLLPPPHYDTLPLFDPLILLPPPNSGGTTRKIEETLTLYGCLRNTTALNISYGATDPSLSDRLLYPHVFRTVQNSHIHNMAVTELLEHFGWTWVGILVSDNDTGQKELQILRTYMRERGICVAFTIKLTEENTRYNEGTLRLLNIPRVRVIIMCGTFTMYAADLLDYYELAFVNRTLILSPSWFSNTALLGGLYVPINVSLAVELSSQPLYAVEKIMIKNKKSHEYSDYYTQKKMEAIFENVDKDFYFEWYRLPSLRSLLSSGVSPRLYNAVEVLVKALHEIFLFVKDKYPENPITGLTQYRQKLQRHLQRMKNPLDPMRPSYYFNEQREAIHGYKIINWIFSDKATHGIEIGNFTPWAVSGQKLHIDTLSITWRHTQEIPVSRCSEPCLPGSRKKTRETIHTCCYDCMPCSEGEISNITDADNCMKCQSDEWSNKKRDRCLPKVMEFISYHNDTIASVSSFVSLFGCLVTIFILVIFISYRDTPIVKANNRNLSYLLLVSIILSFLSVFLFLGRPSDVTCRLRETSFGVFFSVAVSSLLAKTVIVCVAFKSTKPGSPWRKWLSVKLPYTIVLLCSSFQVVICVLWLSISPPFQDLDTQSYPEKIIIQCNEGSDLWFYSMLGYMGLLAAVSFLLAFMVRTLPDSFNEAKYITFSMLLFCSVWMAMIPAYLSTRGKYMVAVEIFAVMASSAGLLACVFFPKCFIILFRPEMNRKTDLLGRRREITEE